MARPNLLLIAVALGAALTGQFRHRGRDRFRRPQAASGRARRLAVRASGRSERRPAPGRSDAWMRWPRRSGESPVAGANPRGAAPATPGAVRSEPARAWARRRAGRHGELLEVTAPDLSFTVGEVAEVIRLRRGGSSPALAEQCWSLTGGWPVAPQVAGLDWLERLATPDGPRPSTR